MQNIAEKSVSLVFRASQGRGLQKFFRGQAPGPPCLLATLAPCPPKSRDLGYATAHMGGSLARNSLDKGPLFGRLSINVGGLSRNWRKMAKMGRSLPKFIIKVGMTARFGN